MFTPPSSIGKSEVGNPVTRELEAGVALVLARATNEDGRNCACGRQFRQVWREDESFEMRTY